MTASGLPHELDIALGRRIRQRRKMVALSQGELAERIGVTAQQIQKYERAENRVSFSRLAEIAQALDCPLLDLIRDLGGAGLAPDTQDLAGLREPGAWQVLEAYACLTPEHRDLIRCLVTDLARGDIGHSTAQVLGRDGELATGTPHT